MAKKKKTTGNPHDKGRNLMPAGKTFTKTITQGPNKGDRVTFKVAPGGKPYPTRVIRDTGSRSTLRDNPGVKFGANKSAAKKKKK